MSDEIWVSQSGVSVAVQATDPAIEVAQSGVSVAITATDPAIEVAQSGVSVALQWPAPNINVAQSGVSVVLCVLPVAPVLAGINTGGNAVLSWTGSNTAYILGWVLEYSHDGITFVPYTNLSTTTMTYTYPSPNHWLVWYFRLRVVHACSGSLYSNTIRMDFIVCELRSIPQLLAEYKVLLYSPAGVLQAEFDAYRSLDFRHVINDVSTATLVLNGRDSRINLFTLNSQIEVWRRLPGYMPAAVPADRRRQGQWYCEWEGLYDDYRDDTAENGDRTFTAYCVGYVDFLRRREILYYATDTESPSNKAATRPAQTAMYEFVRENAGPDATTANGRLVTGTITGLQIPALIGGGPAWSGARAWRNLLDVLQDLAEYGGVDFDVIGKGAGTWSFETYVDQLGQDRTTTGMNYATGLNAAGNVPVVFAASNDNFASGELSSNNRRSANVIAALGQGEGTARLTALAIDSSQLDAARLNQRELTRNASSQASALALLVYAESVRNEFASKEDLTFEPLITSTTVYGVHFWWTDRVTAIYNSVARTKRITQVTIKVDARGERFSGWEFETL